MARMLRVACVCVCALGVSRCGDPAGMAPNTAVFGAPESVSGGTQGAAETVCQKFEECGLLDEMAAGSRDFGLQAGVARFAQLSPFGDPAVGASSPAMGACIDMVEGFIEQGGANGAQIPWDAIAYCMASAPCSRFASKDGMEGLAIECMRQAGIDPGSTGGGGSTSPPKPSDDVCDQAADKLRRCIAKLECDEFEGDIEKKAICESLKKADTSSTAACEGAVRAAAVQINACTLDELCRCSGGGSVIPDDDPPPTNGGSVDNYAACQHFVDSVSCGSWDAATSVNCDGYKNVTTCSLTDYFDCLTESFACVNEVPDTSGWAECYSLATCN